MPRRIELDGTIHEFPDDFTDQDIQKALGAQSPPGAPQGGGLAEAALGILPAVGGGVGGVLGGVAGAAAGGIGAVPGALAGAGIGGAAGEVARQGISSLAGFQAKPKDLKQAVTQTAVEGGKQALWELGGSFVAQGGRLVGKSMLAAMMKRAGPDAPKLAEIMLQEGIPATKNGADKLTQKIAESADQTRQIARQVPTKFHPLDILNDVINLQGLAGKVQGKALASPTIRRLNKLTKTFLRDHQGPQTAEQLLNIRQDADAIAAPIHKAISRDEYVPPLQSIVADWHKAVADRARVLLHQVDEIATSDARTADLATLRDHLLPTIRRSIPMAVRAGGPTTGLAVGSLTGTTPTDRAVRGAAGAAIGGALTNPVLLSHGALMLASPLLQQVFRQIPRGADATVKLASSP